MCVCWFDVFLSLFNCISVSVLLWHDVGYWTKKKALFKEHQDWRVLHLFLLIPQNPPALACQSNTGRHNRLTWPPTFPSRNGILIGSPAASCGLLIRCLSLPLQTNTHTHTPYVCVFVCVILCSILEGFFDFFFLSTAWTIQLIVTKSSRKYFKEITTILLSFLSSKCKKSASVFQLSKPQWHYFCIQMGQKIYLYIYI